MTSRNEPLSNEQIQKLAPSAFAGQPWSGMSSKYAFVPTSNIIDGMRNAGFVPVSASQSVARISDKQNFTKHMIRFRSVNTQLTKVGDSILENILVNAHDGSSAYVNMLGVLRLKCLNGLVVSDGFIASVHIRHVGNIVDDVINSTLDLIDQAPKLSEMISRWSQILLSRPEQLALAAAAKELRYDADSNMYNAVEPELLLSPRRYDDNGTDLWATFNRIQENTVRGGLRANRVNGRRTRIREVKGIDENVKLNKALWTLAEKMAELKGV